MTVDTTASIENEDNESSKATLLRLSNSKFLVIPDKESSLDLAELLKGSGAVIKKLGPIVYSALELAGLKAVSGTVLFEMSPESLEFYNDSAFTTANIGEYFRGVARTTSGQTAHQFQLREVESLTSLNPASVVLAGQMMAIQASLDRLESSVEELHSKTDWILDFLKGSQKAAVDSALRIINEVSASAQATGRVDDEDWDRVAQLEEVLEKTRNEVRRELESLLETEFSGNAKAVGDNLEKLKIQRIVELMSLHGLLVHGIFRWRELYILRKHNKQHLTEHDFESSIEYINELAAERGKYSSMVEDAMGNLKSLELRPWKDALWNEGIVIGRFKDKRRIKKAQSMALELEAAPLFQHEEMAVSLELLDFELNGEQKSDLEGKR